MPFTTDIDGSVTAGETKSLVVSPQKQDGTFFVPDSLTATITLADGTTTSKALADFQREGDALVVPIDFSVAGRAEIEIEVEDEKGNVEQITGSDGATVFVGS
jgi:hypothetical protein